METSVGVRFLALKPLGKLAKWLRILGFDTLYETEMPASLFRNGRKDRVLLTRTLKSVPDLTIPFSIFIRSDHVQEQLRQVLQEMKLNREAIHPFSRCIRCNQSIQSIHKNDAAGHIPDHVWETHEVFSICTSCGRIYWPGSHTERTGLIIATLFHPSPSPD